MIDRLHTLFVVIHCFVFVKHVAMHMMTKHLYLGLISPVLQPYSFQRAELSVDILVHSFSDHKQTFKVGVGGFSYATQVVLVCNFISSFLRTLHQQTTQEYNINIKRKQLLMFCSARDQLNHRPVPVCGLGIGDHCSRTSNRFCFFILKLVTLFND